MIATLAIRAPHGLRSRSVKVVNSRKGPVEAVSAHLCVDRVPRSADLDRIALASVRGLSASRRAVRRRVCLPSDRPLVLLAVACGSGDELVGHSRGTRKPSARDDRDLRACPSSDVRRTAALRSRSVAPAPELDRWTVLSRFDCVISCASTRPGGTDHGRSVWG